MSQENTEIVRRFLDRAHGEPDQVWDIFDEGVVWEVGSLRIPDLPPTCRGPDEVREFFRRWAGAFEDWHFEADEPVPLGRNGVLVRIEQWGRGKGSGATVNLRFWQAWEMRDGKAVRVAHHYEKADALDAIGSPD
jgi:ketosteroid isomerase-like protein